MDVKLVSVTPKGTRKVFPLVAPVTTLGRQSDCDLQVPLGEISRQHCEVHIEKNKVVLKDLGSANGTFVNGQKITQQELKAGDLFSLANAIKFIIQVNGQPAEIDDSKFRSPSEAPVEKLKKAAPPTAPSKPAPKTTPVAKPAAKAATPFTANSATHKKVEDDDADKILGESFFLDSDEDEE